MNKKYIGTFLKTIFIGIFYVIITVVFQKLITPFILNEKVTKPDTSFIISISLVLFFSGVLFSAAYLLLAKGMPVKNKILKGIIFGLLVYLSSYFAQVLGLTGKKYELDGFNFEMTIVVNDFIATIITFVLIAFLFKVEETEVNIKTCSRKSLTKAMILNGAIFPISMFLITQIVGLILPFMNIANSLNVKEDNIVLFYFVFYLCFIITGGLIPLFYRITEYNIKNNYIKFAIIYSVCIWAPVVFAMLAFGSKISEMLVFELESIPCILINTYITSKFLKENG